MRNTKFFKFIAYLFYTSICFFNIIRFFFSSTRDFNYKEIPIIINNRNRLTFLSQLIESLQSRGYNNIVILDNNSTYPPLLDFYRTITCKVIFLKKNLGFDALDKIPLGKEIRKNFFVYTDSDVVPIEECPDDFLKFFLSTLKKYQTVQKVGFSLKIDDLPDTYESKKEVIAWEKQFHENQINDKLYLAQIDTTFALHRPYAPISIKGRFKMIRTSYPYTARHLPWYVDSANLSEEEKFYINHVEIGTQWTKGLEVRHRSFLKYLFME
jgi:hypothetical protein